MTHHLMQRRHQSDPGDFNHASEREQIHIVIPIEK